MYVNLYIVELSFLGYNQVPIIGSLAIESKYQESGHLIFDPSMYVRVRKKNIITINIIISPKLVKSILFKTMWSPFASTFAADHFWLRPI